MAGKGKKITAAVLLLAAIGAAVAFYMWNKPHRDVSSTDGIKVAAAVLYKTFITDSVTAKKNYLQQVVEIKGIVNGLSKNQQGQTVITFKTAIEGAYINCTMEGGANEIKEGNGLAVKGICEGIGQADADLGIMGDVYLVRCYTVK